ncbi:MAG: hypothetical protein Q8O36_08555 [Candidatus Omnitrophota bacterium]|nr:hypothetical protein [Candidatus Omnitrophota bacterium]
MTKLEELYMQYGKIQIEAEIAVNKTRDEYQAKIMAVKQKIAEELQKEPEKKVE